MEKVAGEVSQETSVKKVAFAGSVGTMIEFYDFYIYGLAAALIFPALFFPELDPTAGLLASLLSGGIFLLLCSTLPEGQFSSWGWWVPFILSIILVGVGFLSGHSCPRRRFSSE